MLLTDTFTIDGARRTGDGYLVANARVARSGVQLYPGHQVGRPEMAMVRVFRPESEVFHKDALHSFAHRPVTMNHPNVMVTADNWRDLASGMTGDEVIRDGNFIRVPMILADAAAIKAVEGGHRELSMGYNCHLEFKDGVTPEGEAYDAVQSQIRANHLAVVTAARGGPQLRIGDSNKGTETMTDKALRTIVVDGLSVETTDAGAQAIEKLTKALDAANGKVTALEKQVADAAVDSKKALDTKDGELTAVKKQLDEAKMTPDKLDAAVSARAAVIKDAKSIAGDKLVTDGKTDVEIRRAAVSTKLGDDAVKAMSDDAVAGAFIAFKPKDGQGNDVLRDALRSAPPVVTDRTAANDAYAKSVEEKRNAWKTKAAAA